MYRIIVSLLVLVLGLALAAGGAWLASLGGSWFYLVLGIALLIAGGLLMARQPTGLTLYGLATVVTLAWALWEVGLDWWALSARGSLLIVLGVLLLLPPMVWAMHRPDEPKARYGPNSAVLAVCLAISMAVGVVSMFTNPHELDGAFSGERMTSTTDTRADDAVPDGEWQAYGRTDAGQRYSPLTQITPENVSDLKVAWTYETGQVRGDKDPGETTYEVTPLMVNDTVYICTPFGRVIALDPESGEEKWRFDAKLQQPDSQTTQHLSCRGVSYYSGPPSPEPAVEPAGGNDDEQAEAGTTTAPGDETADNENAPASETQASTDTQAGTEGGQEGTASSGAQDQADADNGAEQPAGGAEQTAGNDAGQAAEGANGSDRQPAAEGEETRQNAGGEEPQPAKLLSPEERLEASVAAVTKGRAGVPQNVVTDLAKRDAPNPRVERERPERVESVPDQCRNRLFYSTADGRLVSLSAETGELCPGFGGADGTVDLWANMPNITPGSVYSTSPPVVTDTLVIVGGAVNDNASATSPSGVIRAYDVNTGELVWNFDSKKPDQTEPIANDETYSENAPNAWSVLSYDPELDLVYLPMGNQSPDQFGGNRSDAVEKYSSSILALHADTGKTAWVYQTVHHDLWDYDVPSQPSLVDLTIDGKTVPALVGPTKQGEIFVLNRETGEPILPVKEVKAPLGAVKGDTTAPTQPKSTVSFEPDPLEESDMWGATLVDQLACRIAFREHRYEGRFTPPTEKGTIVYPGNFGVFNWGAVAVDPNRQVMFAMPVYLAFTSKLVPRDDAYERVVSKEGEAVFNENFGAPYAAKMGPFVSPIGLPCQQPPWGYVAGVDLTNGKTVYRHVNGTVRDLSPIPLPFKMGVPGIGGPIVTKGGVAFLSGTMDYYVRAYDLKTGKQLWRERLPAGGQATPATYEGADGRQYVIVVAGGHGSTGTKAGDSIIAYALPQDED